LDFDLALPDSEAHAIIDWHAREGTPVVGFSHTETRSTSSMPRNRAARSIKKAISLPEDLALFATTTAREEGKTVSAVIQDAMRAYRLSRLRGEYQELQGYWAARARDRGVLSDRDLERYLSGKPRK